ncbi:MAG: hypothetical protein VW547_07215 [Alphaproteobacteria bacterium]
MDPAVLVLDLADNRFAELTARVGRQLRRIDPDVDGHRLRRFDRETAAKIGQRNRAAVGRNVVTHTLDISGVCVTTLRHSSLVTVTFAAFVENGSAARTETAIRKRMTPF